MRKIVTALTVLLLSAVLTYGQSRIITGQVKDDKGNPVPFATVKVKGSNRAVSADQDGNFKIDAGTSKSLVFSATGFDTNEMPLGTQSVLAVSLNTSTAGLQEVVVTALGVKAEKKALGYSATSVSNKVLTQAKSVNIQQALNGKVSGVNISTVNSGVFENAKINIRGIRSLTGNNQPMLIIDGAPTPLGYLSSIPPDDVQDITVLKSAASAAIYGPDAVNGVIVVTTKRGTKKPTVTFNSTINVTRVSFFPKFQREFGAGAGEGTDEFGNYTYVPYENQQYGPKFDGSIQEIGPHLEDGDVQKGPYNDSHYNDKVKFWNSGFTWQNSLTVAGEDFYASVNDANIKGLVPGDKNRRTSFRFNGGKKYGNFSINYGLNYVLQNYDVVNEYGLSKIFPTSYNGSLFFLVMQVPSNVPLLSYKDWRNSKYAQYSNYFNEYALNPYWVTGNIRQHGREDDFIGSLDLSYQFFPWLKATARVSTNLAFTQYQNTTSPVEVTQWALDNRNANQYINQPGSVAEDMASSARINLDYFLSGNHAINNDLSVKYVLGGMVRENRLKDVAVGGANLAVPFLYNVNVRSGDANTPTFGGQTVANQNDLYPDGYNNYIATSRLVSAYGSVGFNYKGWANLELTGRNDWDSRLAPGNQSFFYPGANAAVVLSDAIPALKESDLLSYVKIRAAISKSGNVNLPGPLGAYALQPTYAVKQGFPYGTTAGFTASSTLPSPGLKPEFVNTKEIGLELGFMKNRINVEATYFFQKNTDQILLITQSQTTGYNYRLANAADFKNYGIEMDLGLTPLVNIGKGRLDLRINATYNDNKVTKTYENNPVIIGGNNGFTQNSVSSPTVNNLAEVGRPAFAFQMTDYVRDPASGKVVVDPRTGYPSLSPELITTGRSLPLWVIGITPTYSVGNFSVGMTWDYKAGHNFYAGMGSDEDFAGISARSAAYGRQRFVFPNSVYMDPSSGKYVPNTNVLVQDGNYGFWTGSATNSGIATNYFASAAAWRLRELNISYNLPQKWIGNGKVIKRLTVSAIGKNLFLFVPKSNQWGDPEFNYSSTGNTFGISSSFQSPASRLFGGSVTVQF